MYMDWRLEVTWLCGGQEQDGGQGEAEGDPAHAEAGRELSSCQHLDRHAGDV